MKPLLPFLLLSACLGAQPFSFGVKAGVPFNGASDLINGPNLDSRYWTVGPTLEIRLPFRVSAGLDALYRRFDSSTGRNVGSTLFTHTTDASHWEFPFFLKYRLIAGPVQPFVSPGGALSYARITERSTCTGDVLLCGSAAGSVTLKSTSTGVGILIGGGVELALGPVKIAPEVRYTHWLTGFLSNAGSNQAALLLGTRF